VQQGNRPPALEEPVASSKNQEREAREARDRLKAYNARQAVHTHQNKRRFRDNLFAGIGVLAIVALAAGVQFFYFSTGPGAPVPEPSASSSAAAGVNVGDVPDITVSEFRTWTGDITINGIPLAIELDGALAPQAVAAFVTDSQSGYYTGKTCHRLVSSPGSAELLQCGSENGDGQSDPSVYAYGPIENAPADGLFPAGYLAIARTGSAYGNGHQFFIVYGDSTLPGDEFGGYTVIGKITSGLDQLISGVVSGGFTPAAEGGSEGTPVIPTFIDSVTVQ
jgi:peptidyl-prolyl cis-trans isomerase B (cyclophilin B)